MPSKYLIRNLRENSYYHAFNRGVDGNDIFLDKQDYEMFLFYLYIYTASPEAVRGRHPDLPLRLRARNLSQEIQLVAYCLMPDHFHLLLKQKSAHAMPALLRQITNGYTTHFNSKYQRVGRLMQGRYRSALVESEYLSVQIARYVHLNPSSAGLCTDPGDYAWSSYKNPVGTNELMNRFGSVEEWERFHQDKHSYDLNLPKIRDLILD